MTVTTAPVLSTARRAPQVAPRNLARLLWVELRHNAIPLVLPLIAALYWFDCYRIAATLPPLWEMRLFYILGQGHALLDFAPFVAGVAAWMGSRDGRRGMGDLVTATVRPRWEVQLAIWAATVVWAAAVLPGVHGGDAVSPRPRRRVGRAAVVVDRGGRRGRGRGRLRGVRRSAPGSPAGSPHR